MKRVTLHYFALLRERAGCSEETVHSAAATLADLYDELRTRHDFPMGRAHLRAAVGDAYAPFDTPLEAGMHVTFIPPIAGG